MEKQNDSAKRSREWFIDSAAQEEFFPPSGALQEAQTGDTGAGEERNGPTEYTTVGAKPVVGPMINERSAESTAESEAAEPGPAPKRAAESQQPDARGSENKGGIKPEHSGLEIEEVSCATATPDSGCNVPPPEGTPRLPLPDSPKGFLRSNITRLGGNAPRQPDDRAGFLVIVQTPQRVRLGQIVNLRDSRNTLGRGCRLSGLADDTGAAEVHAAITFESGTGELGFFLYTNHSAPVMVNDGNAAARTLLRSSDRITIANTRFLFFEALFGGGTD